MRSAQLMQEEKMRLAQKYLGIGLWWRGAC